MRRRLFIVVQSAVLPRAQAARLATALGARFYVAAPGAKRGAQLRRALHRARLMSDVPVVWWERQPGFPLPMGARLGRLCQAARCVRVAAVTGPNRRPAGVWAHAPWLAAPGRLGAAAAGELAAAAARAAKRGCPLAVE